MKKSVEGANPSQFSRAIFVFLAVFVGIFGIHDFYAKRVRAGSVHLCLLLPWILLFFASVLGVFVSTLSALTYSPHRQAMQECRRDLKICEKDIIKTERALEEEKQKLKEAKEGRLRKPKEIDPSEDAQKLTEIRSPDAQKTREVVPSVDVPTPKVVVSSVDALNPRVIVPQVDVDSELVEELTHLVETLRRSLDELEQRQMSLKKTLELLPRQQSPGKIPVWINAGYSLLYFFFFVLPLASWVMAMIEIVCVTKDGFEREFNH